MVDILVPSSAVLFFYRHFFFLLRFLTAKNWTHLDVLCLLRLNL
jgi:hypothetical protein